MLDVNEYIDMGYNVNPDIDEETLYLLGTLIILKKYTFIKSVYKNDKQYLLFKKPNRLNIIPPEYILGKFNGIDSINENLLETLLSEEGIRNNINELEDILGLSDIDMFEVIKDKF